MDVAFTSTVAPLGGSIKRDPPYGRPLCQYIKEPAMADLPNCETLLLNLRAVYCTSPSTARTAATP